MIFVLPAHAQPLYAYYTFIPGCIVAVVAIVGYAVLLSRLEHRRWSVHGLSLAVMVFLFFITSAQFLTGYSENDEEKVATVVNGQVVYVNASNPTYSNDNPVFMSGIVILAWSGGPVTTLWPLWRTYAWAPLCSPFAYLIINLTSYHPPFSRITQVVLLNAFVILQVRGWRERFGPRKR